VDTLFARIVGQPFGSHARMANATWRQYGVYTTGVTGKNACLAFPSLETGRQCSWELRPRLAVVPAYVFYRSREPEPLWRPIQERAYSSAKVGALLARIVGQPFGSHARILLDKHSTGKHTQDHFTSIGRRIGRNQTGKMHSQKTFNNYDCIFKPFIFFTTILLTIFTTTIFNYRYLPLIFYNYRYLPLRFYHECYLRRSGWPTQLPDGQMHSEAHQVISFLYIGGTVTRTGATKGIPLDPPTTIQPSPTLTTGPTKTNTSLTPLNGPSTNPCCTLTQRLNTANPTPKSTTPTKTCTKLYTRSYVLM
jgi:hypothetical protein